MRGKVVLLSLLSALSLVVALAVAPIGARQLPSLRQQPALDERGYVIESGATSRRPLPVPPPPAAPLAAALLTGPVPTPSTAGLSASSPAVVAGAAAAKTLAAKAAASDRAACHASAGRAERQRPAPTPRSRRDPPISPAPTVSCQPLGPGCDPISTSAGGAVGVKGLNAVDSGTLPTNPLGDIEPADQGLCAGNGYVVETNNIGEILVFNQRLHRLSSPIP